GQHDAARPDAPHRQGRVGRLAAGGGRHGHRRPGARRPAARRRPPRTRLPGRPDPARPRPRPARRRAARHLADHSTDGRNAPMTSTHYGDLEVTVLPTNEEAGAAAAAVFAAAVNDALRTRAEIAVILATGNSQLAFTEAVTAREDIDWSRITVLHMDEYLGMSADHPASFRRWMRENVEAKVDLKALEGVRGDHEPAEEEIARYSRLIEDLDPAVCVMGIGENGHLAFNDPPADFETPELMRLVEMDEVSRRQQVGEGHFPSLDDAPTHALTM